MKSVFSRQTAHSPLLKSMNDLGGQMYSVLQNQALDNPEVEYNYLGEHTLLIGYPPLQDDSTAQQVDAVKGALQQEGFVPEVTMF